jgi:hypothetical protein
MKTSPRLAAVLLLATLVTVPLPALAGGGLLLDAQAPTAVDQRRQRILFELPGDGTVTAHVEIGFDGEAASFGWLIPVPAAPTLDVSPAAALMMLDAATAPRIIPPATWGEAWDEGDDDDDDDAAGDDDDDNDDDGDGVPALDVELLPQVGPYDPVALDSDDVDELAAWLNDNGYLVTEPMKPLLAFYVDRDWQFLGLRLAPDSGVRDIAPIKITWSGDAAQIPLVLVGVAAEPEMGILALIAADQRWAPENAPGLFVDDSLLRADPRTGESNYYALLSYLGGQEAGPAVFTEYSDSTAGLTGAVQDLLQGARNEEAVAFVAGLEERHAWISRLYARVSASEMVQDVTLAPAGTATVSNRHDLSGQPAVHVDLEVDVPLPCNDTWCGDGGACASTMDGYDGCACDDGWLARRIHAPRVGSLAPMSSVTCQDASHDLLASVALADACAGFDCGENGACVVHGGFPTCQCESGYAATTAGIDGLLCRSIDEVYEAEQLLWPGWPDGADPGGDDDDDGDGGNRAVDGEGAPLAVSCGASSLVPSPSTLLPLLLIPLLTLRLRRD